MIEKPTDDFHPNHEPTNAMSDMMFMGGDMMNSFDFSSIEEMDPSIADGYRVIYDRECPFELRVQESADSPQQVSNLSVENNY